MADSPDLGLIEGFYGHPWSWSQRQDMATFLAEQGYGFYIYAPKSDPCLRAQWTTAHDSESAQSLHELAKRCRQTGIAFGIGLSPLGLQDIWDVSAQHALTNRLMQLSEFQPEILCLLFDDAPALGEDLAPVQAQICNFSAECLPNARLIMCPSFYSRDPLLETLFGARPEFYWEQLGSLLEARWQIFWTGERVCSTQFCLDEIRDIGNRLQRKPVIWDNYPVNDGARSSRFLNLDAYRDRPAALSAVTSGHAANPMNQANLSRLALSTLPQVYRQGLNYDPDQAFADACRRCVNDQFALLLRQDLFAFQHRGLDQFTDLERRQLRARYAGMPSGLAREIVAWLDGEYAFDPACLTG